MEQCLDSKIKQFQLIVDNKVETLTDIWSRTFGEDICDELLNKLSEHCRTYYAGVVTESLEWEAQTEEEINAMKEKAESLRILLQLQNPVMSNTDNLDSLVALKSELEGSVAELFDTLRQREQQAKELLAEQAALCGVLGEKATRTLPTETPPSSEDINEFRKHLDALRHTKMMRLQQVNEIRTEISKMLKSLGIKLPMNDEYAVFHEAVPKLNNDTIATLRSMHEYYSKQIEYQQISVLYKERSTLCDRLAALHIKPDSLRYHNRGGQLLKDEKQRKTLSELLSKVEQKLDEFLQRYEDQENKPFLLDGQNIREFMREQHRKINLQKNLGLENNMKNTQSPALEDIKRKTKKLNLTSEIRVPQQPFHLNRSTNLAVASSNLFQNSSSKEEKSAKNNNEHQNFLTVINSLSCSRFSPKSER